MNQPFDLTVMMYHYIRDPGDRAEAGSGLMGMPVGAFEAQLDELSRRYTFVTWRDMQMALQGNSILPESACLLTFDDGVCDHYLHAFRVLHDRKISGLFFVLDRSKSDSLVLGHKIHFLLATLGLDAFRESIWRKLGTLERAPFIQAEESYQRKYPSDSTDERTNLLKAVLQRDLSVELDPLLSELFEKHVGSEKETAQSYYLNREQIQEMAAGGMHFGGHSRTHPWFDWIAAEARKTEIQASASWLRQFEAGPWAFAFPYGGFSDDSPDLLREQGFIAAFTTRTQIRHTNPYSIGRLDGEELTHA